MDSVNLIQTTIVSPLKKAICNRAGGFFFNLSTPQSMPYQALQK